MTDNTTISSLLNNAAELGISLIFASSLPDGYEGHYLSSGLYSTMFVINDMLSTEAKRLVFNEIKTYHLSGSREFKMFYSGEHKKNNRISGC